MKYKWRAYHLGEITELVIDYRGKTPKKLGGDWSESGYRALSAKNIKTGHIVQPDTIRFVSEEMYHKWMKDEIQRGDIIITSEAPFGQILYWDSEEKIVLSQRLFGVRVKKEHDSKFVYYYMTTSDFQGEMDGRATGTTVVGLRQSELMKCVVRCPNLDTQKKIASILSSIDEKILINDKINENLEQQAQALFKSWFLNYEPWKGIAPNSWLHGKLGDFADIKRGGSPRPIQEYLSDSGLRWLKISDVTSLQTPFIIDIKDHIIEEGLKKTVFLKAGSLVLSNSATPGIPKILDVDSCIHDGWLYFPESKFSNEYLYLYFKYIRQQLVNLSNGSVFNNLKTDILKGYPTILPDEETLQRFDGIIKPMFLQMQNLTRESHNLMDLRDTILPRLMSGELDVSGIDL